MNSDRELPVGPLIIDVAGLTLTPEDRELIAHPLTGGVILFSRNYTDLPQLQELTRQIRASRRGPLLISVDQEGGRVQRFTVGFTAIPPMRHFGELYDANPDESITRLREVAALLAFEIRRADIDFSFAPVVDIDHALCAAIGDRALHNTPDGVLVLAQAVMEGFAIAGCSSVIKHFPGHGGVALDTHKDFARDNRTLAQMQSSDMGVFNALCASADALMPAHVIYPQIDELPASLSSTWQRKVLRQQMQYRGVIISDDLSMHAVSGLMSQADACAMALSAATDLVLICNNRQAAIAAYDHSGITTGGPDQFARRLSLQARTVNTDTQRLASARAAVAAMS